MAALVQSIYASSTLYRTDGGQVNRYGFAAPGLTVLPYAVMSALNFMANLVAPHYPTLYLVRSEIMEEAERRTRSPFHYVVGKVVEVLEESGSNNNVMEGWSEIAGSFEDDDNLLYVSPSAEEDEKMEIHDSSRRTIYVPACPRFQRTDDSQTSPLRQFIESSRGPVFSRGQYMVQSLRQSHRLVSTYARVIAEVLPSFQLDLHELFTVYIICSAEFLTTLALSRFKSQQSTVAQRAWTVTWLLAGSLGAGISYFFKAESRGMVCFAMFAYGAPAVGGFIVVCQMLKAYGICYQTV